MGKNPFFTFDNIAASHSQAELVSELVTKATEQKERLILAQLNDFISRGLIVVKEGQMTFTRSITSDTIEMRQTVELVLKDKEYIETLEKENKELKERLERIQQAIKNV